MDEIANFLLHHVERRQVNAQIHFHQQKFNFIPGNRIESKLPTFICLCEIYYKLKKIAFSTYSYEIKRYSAKISISSPFIIAILQKEIENLSL